MRPRLVFFAHCCLAFSASALGADAEPQIRHRFVCVDNGANRLVHVDQRGEAKSWSVSIPGGSRDVQYLNGGKLLVSHGNGAAEYSLAAGKRLAWVVDRYRGIQTARRLDDGHTLLATKSGKLYELDPAGEEVGKLQIDVQKLNMRLMRVLPNGNLIVGSAGPRAAIEVKRSGEVVKTMPLPDKGYTAIGLPDGKTMAGIGGKARILTLDVEGKIVRQVGGKDAHPDLGLDFCSGWDRLENGNCVMANWLGHGKHGTGPHLVEFTPENEIAWTWPDHTAARQVTNVLVLDDRIAADRDGKRGKKRARNAPDDARNRP